MKKTKKEFSRIIEGILFASTDPISAENLIKYFQEEEKPALALVKQILGELQTHYQTRGIELVEVASGFRFQAAKDLTPTLSKSMVEKPSRYSRALLETLALIAYRQPITRGEIEDIRGVAVSSHIIKTLDEHEWIRIVGYKEVPGKPALFATTKSFLDHFGLKSLEELPPLAELRDFENLQPLEFSDQMTQMIKEAQEQAEAEQAEEKQAQTEEAQSDETQIEEAEIAVEQDESLSACEVTIEQEVLEEME
jgi:segregation and condensation protein B